MTFSIDVHCEYELVLRRSITIIHVIINNILIIWISKFQKTVETSHYSSEFVTSKNDTDLILEVR
jgi:hypothetical protein